MGFLAPFHRPIRCYLLSIIFSNSTSAATSWIFCIPWWRLSTSLRWCPFWSSRWCQSLRQEGKWPLNIVKYTKCVYIDRFNIQGLALTMTPPSLCGSSASRSSSASCVPSVSYGTVQKMWRGRSPCTLVAHWPWTWELVERGGVHGWETLAGLYGSYICIYLLTLYVTL